VPATEGRSEAAGVTTLGGSDLHDAQLASDETTRVVELDAMFDVETSCTT
jgi:hypothetical protein